MSVQDATTFLKKFKEDEDLRKKVAAAASAEDKQAIVKDLGLHFTKSEMQQAEQAGGSVLSDADLEKVAGGGGAATAVAVAASIAAAFA